MVRFLHTADWQMGMKAARFGEAGKRVREERLAAGRRVIEAARQRGVDFILVAGDLFEDNAVDRTLVQQGADILASASCTVFVLPGNHDPLVPGSVWEHRCWKRSSNVVILKENAPLAAPGCTLFPCPLREKQSGENPADWIRAEPDGFPLIGVAHGSVEGAPIGEWDHPIPRNAPARSGLDYLALGHWHSLGTFEDASGASRMAYSGTHEPTSFGERNSGNALLVEIASPGAAPVLTPLSTGGLEWISRTERIYASGDLEALGREMDTLPKPENTLLDLSLSGLMRPSDREELDRITELAKVRFLWAWVDPSGMAPAPEDDSWVEALPPGLLREVARRIKLSEAEPEVKVRALLDLFSIVKESRP